MLELKRLFNNNFWSTEKYAALYIIEQGRVYTDANIDRGR